MVDFRVNDGLGNHPKIVGISLEAIGLWTLAGAWSMRYLTDGRIPGPIMASMCKRQRVVAELVDRNLLIPIDDDWQFVDWLQYQRSRAQIEADRERGRKRLADWRARNRGP
jgi:hypothetical protein